MEVVEAFSPIRSNSGRLHLPRQPANEAKTNPDRSTVLESPFNSQRETTSKSHTTHPLRTPRTPTSRRKRSPSPYVFVNDLPPWEWYFPADSEASLRGDGSQSQSVRESMRQSGGERQAVKGNDLTAGQIFPPAPTSVMDIPTWVQRSPEAGSESFLTDASITDIAGVPPTHPSGKATDDGRQMHRMPVLLKDLDHAKFLEGSKKREKATKPPQQRGKKSGEEKRAAGGLDKRVRELQVGGKERNVRPIKEFLPLHMRVKHVAGKTDGNPEDVSMVDDSVVDDISFAESIQEDPAGDGGGEGIRNGKEQRMRKEKTSVTLDEVREAAVSSSRPSASESTMTHLDGRRAMRRDEERFGAVYDTIPQVSDVHSSRVGVSDNITATYTRRSDGIIQPTHTYPRGILRADSRLAASASVPPGPAALHRHQSTHACHVVDPHSWRRDDRSAKHATSCQLLSFCRAPGVDR